MSCIFFQRSNVSLGLAVQRFIFSMHFVLLVYPKIYGRMAWDARKLQLCSTGSVSASSFWENIDIYMELHTIVYNLFYSNHPTNSIFSMWSTLNYHGTGVSMLFTHCFTLVFHVETFVLCGFKISVGQRVNIGQYCLMLWFSFLVQQEWCGMESNMSAAQNLPWSATIMMTDSH